MVISVNVVVQHGSFIGCHCPFFKYQILLWTRLTGNSEQANAFLLDRILELHVYLCPGWECLPRFRRQEWISDSKPSPVDRGHYLSWNQTCGWRGGCSCRGTRDMHVCDVSKKEGVCVFSWHRSCWRFRLIPVSHAALYIQKLWFSGLTWPSATHVPYD